MVSSSKQWPSKIERISQFHVPCTGLVLRRSLSPIHLSMISTVADLGLLILLAAFLGVFRVTRMLAHALAAILRIDVSCAAAA